MALSCLRSGGLRKMEDSLGRNQLSILQIQELATELQNVNDLPLSHAEKSLNFGCCPNWGRGQGGVKVLLIKYSAKAMSFVMSKTKNIILIVGKITLVLKIVFEIAV